MTRPGDALRPIVRWSLYPLTVQHVRRSSVTPGIDAFLVPQYQTFLRALGLDDPTEASRYWERSQALADEARAVRPEATRADLGELLAEGQITPRDAAKMLAKQPDPRAAENEAKGRKELLGAASRRALLKALQSIFDYTEEGWLALLRPIITDAVEKQDDNRFGVVHGFAAWLREPRRNKVFGLAAATSSGYDAERYLYQVARPDLLFRWRVERASDPQRYEASREAVNGIWRAEYQLRPTAPYPRLRDFDESWGVGLYSAAEVVANVANTKAQQEAEFARLTSPAAVPPATGQKRRTVVII